MAKVEFKVVCVDCGADAPVDTEKSTDNWTVHKNHCDSCGGKTKMTVV